MVRAAVLACAVTSSPAPPRPNTHAHDRSAPPSRSPPPPLSFSLPPCPPMQEKSKYDRIIGEAFGGDKGFQNALNAAFEHFLNLNARSPE